MSKHVYVLGVFSRVLPPSLSKEEAVEGQRGVVRWRERMMLVLVHHRCDSTELAVSP